MKRSENPDRFTYVVGLGVGLILVRDGGSYGSRSRQSH